MVKSSFIRFAVNKAITWKHASERNYQELLEKSRIIGYTSDEWIHQRTFSNAYLQIARAIDRLPDNYTADQIQAYCIAIGDKLNRYNQSELWCAYYDVVNNTSWIIDRA